MCLAFLSNVAAAAVCFYVECPLLGGCFLAGAVVWFVNAIDLAADPPADAG
jgi:hypothetical protein